MKKAIALYLDEDSTAWDLVRALRQQEIDITTVGEVNRYGYTDEEQLQWSTAQNRVLYSSNIRDFCRIHTEFLNRGESHAGIILVQQQRYSIGQITQGILQLMEIKSADEMANQVVFLSGWITK
ncbi:MAG: DUF5615 family PIN-like protein [Spirulina sp.]